MANSEVLQPGLSIKPCVEVDDVYLILKKIYGLKVASINNLNGYDDKNYHVIVDLESNDKLGDISRSGYVLKIINLLDSKKKDVFEAQTQLLLHLAQNKIKCSKPVKSLTGEYCLIWKFKSGEHLIRLLEYIDGTILCKIPCTSKIFYDSGRYIANLDNVLKSFDHTAYHQYNSLWKMNNIPKLNEYLFAVKDEENKNLAEQIIENFKTRVLETNQKFEQGIIHGDFNEQNIIVQKVNGEWEIDSILDFGDTHHSCYLYELAIAMTYMILQGNDVDVGGHVLAGYLSCRDIPEHETRLLKICIEGRLTQSVVLGAYTIMEDPQNTYVLSTQQEGWKMLRKLNSFTDDNLLRRWIEICDSYKS